MRIKIKIFVLAFNFCMLLCIGQISAQLKGSYTINPSSPVSATNYLNFLSAVSDMESGTRTDHGPSNGKGVSGPVSFDVANGIYPGQLLITYINGLSGTNTVSFQSASRDSSKVILVDSTSGGTASTNYLVYIKSTRNIHFKGMSFLRPAGGNVIYLSSASHIKFENNVIAGNDNFSSAVSDLDVHTSNDSFISNAFKNTGNGIHISNYNGDTDSNCVIHNNIFFNVVKPIYAVKQTNISITGNRISGNFNVTSTGIDLYQLKGPAIIKNNIITLEDSAILTGVYLHSVNIYLSPGGPVHDTSKILVADNMISLHSHSSKNIIRGLDLEAVNFTDIVYNTVLVDTSISAYAFPLYFDLAGDTVRILNNDFANKSGKNAACFLNSFSFTTDSLNYNNYFGNQGMILWNPSGNSSGKDTEISNVASLKSIDPQEINNISVLPSFVSPNNLHTNTLVLHGKGIPFKLVKDDIDGKLRDKNHPDIGANELIVKHDLGIDSIKVYSLAICKNINTTLLIHSIITNFGADSEKNIAFYYKIWGTADSGLAYKAPMTIKSDSTDTLSFPIQLNIKDTGIYKVSVFIKIDSNQNITNDTVSFYEHVISAPKPSFTFSLACADRPLALKITTKTYRNLNYQWNFGDGASISAKDTSHIFYIDTVYTTVLESIDSIGCTDTVSHQIKPLPISYSSFSYHSSGASYSFTADDTSYRKYEWAFGDGDSSAILKPSHTYNHNGIYPVTLFVQDANGCYDSVEELIDISNAGIEYQKPVVNEISASPNPFHESCDITYQLTQSSSIQIALYDVFGNEKAMLVHQIQCVGFYTISLNTEIPDFKPGVYFVRYLIDGEELKTMKILYL